MLFGCRKEINGHSRRVRASRRVGKKTVPASLPLEVGRTLTRAIDQ